MPKNFRQLVDKMPPEAQARVERRKHELLAEMELQEIRRALHISQEQLAAQLEITQGAASKLERRDDMLVSTLRRIVEALGGQLEIQAHFPHVDVRIRQRDSDYELTAV